MNTTRMKLFGLFLVLLTPIVALSQSAPHADAGTTKVGNLNDAIADDIKTNWLEVLSEETKILANNQRWITYSCLLYAFGKRAWWNTPGDD